MKCRNIVNNSYINKKGKTGERFRIIPDANNKAQHLFVFKANDRGKNFLQIDFVEI